MRTCPNCQELSWSTEADCSFCGVPLVPGKTRVRWFCAYCGSITQRHPDPRDGKVRCHAHSTIPPDHVLIPPDPLTSLPTLAAQLREDTQPTEGKVT